MLERIIRVIDDWVGAALSEGRSRRNRAEPAAFLAWGRWESNPHELPRPLLRRLRLPFRHFPAELRLIRVEHPAGLGGVANGAKPQMQLGRAASEDEGDQLGVTRLAHVEVGDVAVAPP
jgi:hypothetical protein